MYMCECVKRDEKGTGFRENEIRDGKESAV